MQEWVSVTSNKKQLPSPKIYRRLYAGIMRFRLDEVLNKPSHHHATGNHTPDLTVRLRQQLNTLIAEGIDAATGLVKYEQLAESEHFETYRALVHQLADFDLSTLADDSQRKAFWVNLYNALIIHGVIAYGIEDSVNSVRGVFERAAYVVGGWRFSANDIEHGILRRNRGVPFLPFEIFRRDDPRVDLMLDEVDARIHFALNCAAQSCPPIGFYDAEKVQSQLDLATRHFVNSGNVNVDVNARVVEVSKVLWWYAVDFGGEPLYKIWVKMPVVLRAIAPYIQNVEQREFLVANADEIRVRFLPYDWKLNV